MMKENKNENEIAEKIAEIALLRTGLVTVEHPSIPYVDLIIRSKEKPDHFFLVEVKKYPSQGGQEQVWKYSEYFPNATALLFIINPSDESGFFEIIEQNQSKGKYELTMSNLTYFLDRSLNPFKPMEYPPYHFYQRESEGQYEVQAKNFDDGFRILRLINLTLTPIEKRFDGIVEVEIVSHENIVQQEPTRFFLGKEFYNPNLKEYVFFVNKDSGTEFTDIELPKGRKSVFIRVKFEGAKITDNFEMKLACRYLKNSSEMSY